MKSENLSNLLEHRRKILKLTQHEFAKILGVSQQAYRQWEAGINTPKPSYMQRIAEALEMSLEDTVQAKINQQHIIQLARSKQTTNNMTILKPNENIQVQNSFDNGESEQISGYKLLIMLASALEKRTLHQHQINTLGSLIDSFVRSSVLRNNN